MKPKWWTCKCGKHQPYFGTGTPVCGVCDAPAPFTVGPSKLQGGLDFGSKQDAD